MTRLVRAEFRKLLSTQVWFWLLVATLAVSALFVVGQLASRHQVTSASDVPDLFGATANTYLVVFVLGVLGVTTEYRYQTITPTVLQTPSRWAIVTAKMITYAVLGALYALAALAVDFAIAVPWLSAKGIDVSYTDSHVLHAVAGVFAVEAIFGIVGLGVGALLRNQVVAVVVGIVFLAVLQNILAAIPGVKHAWPYTPGGAVAAVVRTGGSDTVNGVHLLPTAGGVVVLLLWALVPALAGAGYTLNRDIT